MAEYIEREKVLRCIKESREDIDWGQSEDGDAFLHYSACLYRTIASDQCLLTADVVEVVRCRDCKHNTLDKNAGNANCDMFYGMTDQNGFCHYGERRIGDG